MLDEDYLKMSKFNVKCIRKHNLFSPSWGPKEGKDISPLKVRAILFSIKN